MNAVLSYLAMFATNPRLVKDLAKIISDEEINTKQLTQETMGELDLKGSPKLSKVLLGVGVDKRRVDMALSGAVAKSNNHVTRLEGTDDLWVWEQGESDYYSSCQNNHNSHDLRDKDMSVFGKTLFFWTVGEPMSVNNKGFIARAKCRVMFYDREFMLPAALYIDRPYGGFNILDQNLHELYEYWNVLSMKLFGIKGLPVVRAEEWNSTTSGSLDAIRNRWSGPKLYCPSAEVGYQDTLKSRNRVGYDFFVETHNLRRVIEQAYTLRAKVGGVYLQSMSDTTYNAQKLRVEISAFHEQKARGRVHECLADAVAIAWRELGRSTSSFTSSKEGCLSLTLLTAYWNGDIYGIIPYNQVLVYKDGDDYPAFYNYNTKEVLSDVSKLGFYQAIKLPYSYVKKGGYNQLVVQLLSGTELEPEMRALGYANAVSLSMHAPDITYSPKRMVVDTDSYMSMDNIHPEVLAYYSNIPGAHSLVEGREWLGAREIWFGYSCALRLPTIDESGIVHLHDVDHLWTTAWAEAIPLASRRLYVFILSSPTRTEMGQYEFEGEVYNYADTDVEACVEPDVEACVEPDDFFYEVDAVLYDIDE